MMPRLLRRQISRQYTHRNTICMCGPERQLSQRCAVLVPGRTRRTHTASVVGGRMIWAPALPNSAACEAHLLGRH
eukprot:scaffold9114_cov118-Isochrysis_galbana.AAC.3